LYCRRSGVAAVAARRFPAGAWSWNYSSRTSQGRRAVNTDGRHDVVDIRPDLADPLRMLVVAFACALVDRRWLRWVPRDPR